MEIVGTELNLVDTKLRILNIFNYICTIMNLVVNYMQQTDEMASTLLSVLVDCENIPHDVFLKAANLIDKWRDSTIELLFLMESGTCLEFDILLDKYEYHLEQCLYYANNYEKEI